MVGGRGDGCVKLMDPCSTGPPHGPRNLFGRGVSENGIIQGLSKM